MTVVGVKENEIQSVIWNNQFVPNMKIKNWKKKKIMYKVMMGNKPYLIIPLYCVI